MRPKQARRWLAAAAAVGLLSVTPALAHGGAWGSSDGASGTWGPGSMGAMPGAMGAMGMGGAQGMPGISGMPSMSGMAGMHGGGMHGGGMRGFAMHGDGAYGAGMHRFGAQFALRGLPLGTVVRVEVFDADPAEGAVPTAELTATVGETSEVAFASELGAASADASYLRISVSEQTRRVVLGGTGALPAGARMAAMPLHGLELGQAIEIAVYAAETDAEPSTTLRFTYGEDSEAAFRSRLTEALDGAAVAEVTLPAHERIVDLTATPYGAAGAPMGTVGGMHAAPAWPPHR